jgi:hypothetical protein
MVQDEHCATVIRFTWLHADPTPDVGGARLTLGFASAFAGRQRSGGTYGVRGRVNYETFADDVCSGEHINTPDERLFMTKPRRNSWIGFGTPRV